MAVSTFLINTCVQAALLFIGSVLIMEGRLSSEVLLAFMLYQGQLQVRSTTKDASAHNTFLTFGSERDNESLQLVHFLDPQFWGGPKGISPARQETASACHGKH